MTALRAAKYVILLSILTLSGYAQANSLSMRLEQLVGGNVKISVEDRPNISVSGGEVKLPKNLLADAGNFDVPVFLILEAIELARVTSYSDSDKAKAFNAAFNEFVTKSLNPRAVMAYFSKRSFQSSVSNSTRGDEKNRAKLLGLLLAEWMRVKGEGSRFRTQEEPAAPLPLEEHKRIRNEILRELMAIVSRPKIDASLTRHLNAIKENNVDLNSINANFQMDLVVNLRRLRELASGTIPHEKLVIYEQLIFKNLNTLYEQEISNILDNNFHLRSAEQFYALRALYIRQPEISIPPVAAAFFAIADPVESNDDKVGDRKNDLEYMEGGLFDFVDWNEEKSRREFFNMFAAAFKGSPDEIFRRLQEANNARALHLASDLTNNADIDFSKTFGVRDGLRAEAIRFHGKLPHYVESLPIELKILGKYRNEAELKKFYEKSLKDILLPEFAAIDITRLPINDLLINSNATPSVFEKMFEKIRGLQDERNLHARIVWMYEVGFRYETFSDQDKSLSTQILQREIDSVAKVDLPENSKWFYEKLLEFVERHKIPIKVVKSKPPTILEVIAVQKLRKDIEMAVRQWEYSREEPETIDTTPRAAVFAAAAKRLIEIKAPQVKDLTVEEVTHLLWLENYWNLKELSASEIDKILGSLRGIASRVEDTRELVTFSSLAQAFLFHHEDKKWKSKIPALLDLADELRLLLVRRGHDDSSVGIFRSHHNVSVTDEKNYQSSLTEMLVMTRPLNISLDFFIFSEYDRDHWPPRINAALEKKIKETSPQEFGAWAYTFLDFTQYDLAWYILRDFISNLSVPQQTWLQKFTQQKPKNLSQFENIESILSGWEGKRLKQPFGKMKDRRAEDILDMYKVLPHFDVTRFSDEDLVNLAKWAFKPSTEPSDLESVDTRDPLFAELFKRREIPAIKSKLLEISPARIFSPKMQTEFVDWRLAALLPKKKHHFEKETIRPIAKNLYEYFNSTMKRSTARDSHLLRWVDKLELTPAEMDMISPLLISKKSLFELVGDGANQRSQILYRLSNPKSQLEKIKMLRNASPPTHIFEKAEYEAYRENDIPIKTLAMYALVHQSLTTELIDMFLGEFGKYPAIKKLAHYYFESLPENERSIVIARLLANGDSESKINLSQMLDLIGPMGARAKQILRMIPALPLEYRQQLDLAFDWTQPPSRFEVVDHLKTLMGKNFNTHVRWVGQLLGSGTLNYGVLLEMRNPKTKKFEIIVARVQKENVGGLVENESIVLKTTTEKALADTDPEVRRLGRIVELVRSRVFASLNTQTGPELNQEIERRFSKELKKMDSSVVGFRNEYLNLVEENNRSRISFMPFVEKVSWKTLESGDRAKLAEEVVRKNLELLENGLTDKDPSRGNVLVDKDKKIRRIDTGQPVRLSRQEITALKYFAALVLDSNGRPNTNLLKFVNQNLDWIFDLPRDRKLDAFEQTRMKQINWDDERELLNRVVLMAEAIDPTSIVSLRPAVADFFEVLLRINSWGEFMPKGKFESIMVKFLSGRDSRIGFVFLGPKDKALSLKPICNQLF